MSLMSAPSPTPTARWFGSEFKYFKSTFPREAGQVMLPLLLPLHGSDLHIEQSLGKYQGGSRKDLLQPSAKNPRWTRVCAHHFS